MQRLFLILPLLWAAPSLADVTHSGSSRFGVAYVSDPSQPHGQMQSLYSGRYTSTFSHEADNGYTFRFEIELEVGNFTPHDPNVGAARAAHWGRDTD